MSAGKKKRHALQGDEEHIFQILVEQNSNVLITFSVEEGKIVITNNFKAK